MALKHSNFFTFILIGAFCLVLNLALFYLLVGYLHWHYIVVTVLAFFSINGIGFWLNKYFTFHQRKTAYLPELIKYYSGMGVSFVINIILIALLISVLKFHYLVASAIVSAALVLINFVLHKNWTFALSPHTKDLSKLRIVLVTHYFPAHGGGIERVAWEIAMRWLSDGETQIKWFASNVDAPPVAANLEIHAVPTWNGVETRYGIPFPIWHPFILAKLWREIRHSDLVHIHDSLYIGNIVTAIFARLMNKPLILTQHIGFIPYKNVLLRIALSLANRTIARLVMSLSNEVIFISASVENYFHTLWKWKFNSRFIPNGVDTNLYRPPSINEREQARIDLGLTPSRPTWLFVGRFVEKKGLLILRQMAQLAPDADWIFAGQGPLDPRAWNIPNVKVYSDRTGETLRTLYWASDLLVLPSIGEGFPLVVQEAMACGLATLVNTETAAAFPKARPFVYEEKVMGDNTAACWSKFLEQHASSPSTRPIPSNSIASFAKYHWSWNSCLEQYKILAQHHTLVK